MTDKAELLRLARETGATAYTNRHYPDRPFHVFSPEQLEAFEAAVLRKLAEQEPMGYIVGNYVTDLEGVEGVTVHLTDAGHRLPVDTKLYAASVPHIPDGWQPIETAPKDGEEIIVMYMHIDTQVVHNGFWLTGYGVNDEDIGWWSYEHSEVSRIKLDGWMTPTHWMPLPPPPKEPT